MLIRNSFKYIGALLIVFGHLGFARADGIQNPQPQGARFNPSMFTGLGDSRWQYITVALGNALTAQQWFNVANALAGHRYLYSGTNAGGSGCRSDQFLAQVNINAVLSDAAQYVIINSPAANDFGALVGNGSPATVGASCTNSGGTFPYTNNNGVSVTSTTVGAVVAQNVINAAEQIIAAGKTPIITEEPGTTTMVAPVSQVYDLNSRLEAYAQARGGRVLIWSYNQAVWAPTASTSAIVFKTGYSTDGVHYAPVGAFAQGAAFNTFVQNTIPVPDLSVANANFINGTTPRSLTTNPLFTTPTGGPTAGSGCGTITGTPPLGWTIACGSAATTITFTNAVDPNGYGNDITMAITTTVADTITLATAAPANGLWFLTDFIAGGADISVASGSSNAACYLQTAIVTNAGSTQQYDMYPNLAGSFPTTAYSLRLRSLARPVNAGSTSQSFALPVEVLCTTTAAGNVTATVSRAWAGRMYQYNSSTGTFSGQ